MVAAYRYVLTVTGCLHAGATAGFYEPMMNFIGSVRYWCPDCHVIAYNLGGWTDEQKARVRSLCKVGGGRGGGRGGDNGGGQRQVMMVVMVTMSVMVVCCPQTSMEWENGPEEGGHVVNPMNYAFKPLALSHAVKKYGQVGTERSR